MTNIANTEWRVYQPRGAVSRDRFGDRLWGVQSPHPEVGPFVGFTREEADAVVRALNKHTACLRVTASLQQAEDRRKPAEPDPDCAICGGDGVDADPHGFLDYPAYRGCPDCWAREG